MGEFNDPVNVAKSIAVRLQTLKSIRAYLTEVHAKYEGLKALERALEAEGVTLEAFTNEVAP